MSIGENFTCRGECCQREFYKIFLCFARAIRNVFEENLRLAKQSPFRTVEDASPYKICGIFDILSVGEGLAPPADLTQKREAKRLPFGFYLCLREKNYPRLRYLYAICRYSSGSPPSLLLSVAFSVPPSVLLSVPPSVSVPTSVSLPSPSGISGGSSGRPTYDI